MSKPKYQKPPLIEAIFEIYTASDKQWEDKTPFEIYSVVNHRYPEINRKPSMFIPIRPHEQPTNGQGELIQFWNKERNQLMHIAPNLLTINCLRPYIGWVEYKAIILDIFERISKIINPQKITKIVYRVVNIVDIKGATLDHYKKYFNVYPAAPDFFVDSPFSTQLNIEKRISDTDTSILWMYTAASTPDYKSPVSAQIIYIDEKYTNLNILEDRIENAHLKVNEIFENLFTNFAKKEFKSDFE